MYFHWTLVAKEDFIFFFDDTAYFSLYGSDICGQACTSKIVQRLRFGDDDLIFDISNIPLLLIANYFGQQFELFYNNLNYFQNKTNFEKLCYQQFKLFLTK
ncbi:hypothetical protein ACJX0J_038325 [Zea mays]